MELSEELTKVWADVHRLAKKQGCDMPVLVRKMIHIYETYNSTLDEVTTELNYYKGRELEVLAMGDTILDGVLLVDERGIITGINKVCANWFGLLNQDIVGESTDFLKKFIDKDVSNHVIKKKESKSVMATLPQLNKRILVTGAPFYNQAGIFLHAIIVLRDMTELLKLKEELEALEITSKRYHGEIEYLKKHMNQSEMIGESPKMDQLKNLIREAAKTDATVLITGETGVGKEVVANEVYTNSLRSNKPYIKINCAAIPENLLESELFGYEKGAFTGALNKEKMGLFEVANSGTILLDEIGELPLGLQSKLLRVLQERELMRVGGIKSIQLNVRVIASTNQDLEKLAKEGKFRQDLFYRLNVIPIIIPPLRDRKEDIALLASKFLKKENIKYGKNKYLDVSVLPVFEQYEWPGNVRELQNIIERLVIFGDNQCIDRKSILQILKNFQEPLMPQKTDNLKYMVAMYEKQILEEVMQKQGSTHKAAKALGVTQPTIVRKLKLLGIIRH